MAIVFISGVFIGGVLGVFLMALVQINHDKEDNNANR